MKKITVALTGGIALLAVAGYCYSRMLVQPHISVFKIKNKADKTELIWRSKSTPYLHAFIIEKSYDGKHFIPFDTINAVRDTDHEFTYVVTDKNAGKYYRLSFTNKQEYKHVWKTIVNAYPAVTAALARDVRSE